MRSKIIAGNLIAVLFVGLVSYFLLRASIERHSAEATENSLGHQRTLFERSWRLLNSEFLQQTQAQAETRSLRQVFTGLDRESRRNRAFNAISNVEHWFADPNRHRNAGPDVVAIVDDTSKVIARNKDINRLVDEPLNVELPSVTSAIRQRLPILDVWQKKDEQKIFQTAIAPIFSDIGSVLGALVVAYDISNGFAQRESKILGCDIAVMSTGGIYSSSLDPGKVSDLNRHLFSEVKHLTQATLASKRASRVRWQTALKGDDVVGLLSYLPAANSTPLAYSVMVDRDRVVAWSGALDVLLILTLLGAIFVIGYGFLVGSSFQNPLEEIEDGVLRVINGNTNFRLDIQSREFGGLAYRINQLINVFTGVIEEDEEGRMSMPPGGAVSTENWEAESGDKRRRNLSNPPS